MTGATPRSARVPLLTVDDLRAYFRGPREPIRAVDGLSYRVYRGEAVAIVGESGSGKTIGVRALLGLLPHGAYVAGGRAMFDGRDLLSMSGSDLRHVRGRRIAMVFQNSTNAMNPTLTLELQLTEHLVWHGLADGREAKRRAVGALSDVGFADPERVIRMYPFQLSGGMRQRAMIAMAIVTEPDLLIADEPTTGLDVTLQRQILDLLAGMKDRGMAVMMITHDLGVARYLCDETVVMYSGRVMERGQTGELLGEPIHPYTVALLNSSLEVGESDRPLRAIHGTPPDPAMRPRGCPFHPRCSRAELPRCLDPQELISLGDTRAASCWKVTSTDG